MKYNSKGYNVAKMEEKNNNNSELKAQNTSKKDRNGAIGSLAFGMVLAALAHLVYEKFFDFPIGQILVYLIGFLAFICFMVAISCFFDYKESKKIEKMEEDARREEKEFSEIDSAKRNLRAEKMFRMNQKELMRYYDMNLSQTKFLSGLGILMIVFGILIVIASLYMYTFLETDKILLIIGSLSGIIVDFIGAIFIKCILRTLKLL